MVSRYAVTESAADLSSEFSEGVGGSGGTMLGVDAFDGRLICRGLSNYGSDAWAVRGKKAAHKDLDSWPFNREESHESY